MMTVLVLRRAATFLVVFVPLVAIAAWAGGGIFLEHRAPSPAAGGPGAAGAIDRSKIVQLEKGALGPGENGRMDRNSVAVVDGKVVPFRAWTTFWGTSEPIPEKNPQDRSMRLGRARIVFYPEPDRADKPPSAVDGAPGTTTLAGNEATFTQRQGARPSAHFEGATTAVHRTEDGRALTLQSEALDYSEELPAPNRPARRILESDRDVRVDANGATLTGHGMRTTLDTARRQHVRIEKNVAGRFAGNEGGAPDARDISVHCDGAADIEALDAPSGGRSDGRQPWRATFREDVVFEDPRSVMKADEVIVDFVRTGAADQKAGAPATEIVRIVATGHVEIRGKGANSSYTTLCERLRAFSEDGRTRVTVLEGAQTLTLDTTTKDGRPSTYSISAKGPSTMRERRTAAAIDSPAAVTLVCEGDVVAIEKDTALGTAISELRAPRVTIEGKRDAPVAPGATGIFHPTLLRGEGGADLRRQDLTAAGRTIAWTNSGGRERLALVGAPVLRYPDREGVNPFDPKGAGKPGILELTAGERIDADIAPVATTAPAAPGAKTRNGTHAVTCAGGMRARKLVDDEATLVMTAKHGTAILDEDGPLRRLRELRATGDAHLVGRGESEGARSGDFTGEDVVISRPPLGFQASAEKRETVDMDATVRGSAALPALAVLVNGKQRHEIRGREIRSLGGGAVIDVDGAAAVDFDLPSDAPPPSRTQRTPGAVMMAVAERLHVETDPGTRGSARVRLVRGDGDVTLRNDEYAFRGDAFAYDRTTGRVTCTGSPARLVRTDDSTLVAPTLYGEFDPAADTKKGFRRSISQNGATLVLYQIGEDKARERVTIVSKGPFEVTTTFAAATQDVTAVFELQRPDGSWHLDSRLDRCRRIDVTLDPNADGSPSERMRTLIATGAPGPRAGARIVTQSPDGGRVATGIAERIEVAPQTTVFTLSCPSGDSRVFVDEQSKGALYECDRATINYKTHEWDSERQVAVMQ